MDAVADLGIVERPVGAKPTIARCPRGSVVRRLEDPEALDHRPEMRRLVGICEDRRQTEVTRRLVRGIVPLAATRLAVQSGDELPGGCAVPALEDACRLRPREDAA